MNVFIFSGNLGSDAEMRFTKGGTQVVQFSVAVTSGWGDKKKTNWVRCTLFGNRGESLAPYLNKGQQVVVSGEFSINEWEGQNGEKNKSPEVKVNEITLVGGKSTPGAATGGQQEKAEPPAADKPKGDFENFDDDIPF